MINLVVLSLSTSNLDYGIVLSISLSDEELIINYCSGISHSKLLIIDKYINGVFCDRMAREGNSNLPNYNSNLPHAI